MAYVSAEEHTHGPEQLDSDAEHSDVGEEQPDLCHADSRAYVRSIVESAWSIIIDGQSINSRWANAQLISLSGIQNHITMLTQPPVTMDMLLHAEPQQTKQMRRSWWSNIESISRCVAGYHHAVGALEHDKLESIRRDICGYAYTLRRGLPSYVDVTEFFPLLLRAITNRAMNMALRTTIEHVLAHDLHLGPQGKPMTVCGRKALRDILGVCLDLVKEDYEKLGNELREFPEI